MVIRRLQFTIVTGLFCLIIHSLVYANPLPTFNSSEHQDIGDKIILTDIYNTPHLTADYPLTLSNGAKITFGTEMALAGDFFAIPDAPISFGGNSTEQEKRFMNTYATLAEATNAPYRIYQLADIFAKEKEALAEGIKKGRSPHDIYAEIELAEGIEFILVDKENFFDFSSLYLRLLPKSFDHFTSNNEIAFKAGYRIAWNMAKSAHTDLQAGNLAAANDKLKLAYSLLAFACHYLTDRFAAGHMRTPMLALHHQFGLVGSLLAAFQHHEENTLGLEVHDWQGHIWRAYGDAWFFEAVNQVHRQHIQDNLQQLVNSLHALATGKEEIHLTPENISGILMFPTENNYFPLFKEENNKILRRKDLTNPYSSEYVENWHPFWTLLALTFKKNTVAPQNIQQELTGAGYHHFSQAIPDNWQFLPRHLIKPGYH